MTYSFSAIRRAYEDILADLAPLEEDIMLHDKLAEDLGFWGDDNDFFLSEMVEKYDLDYSTFDYSRHFEDEGELFPLHIQLLQPLFILMWLGWLLFERAYPGYPTPDPFKERTENPRLDLTVGDLIAWRLAGHFCLRADADIRVG